ncbi:MAG TPA: YqgE/AlgH family protein [Anaeromyxobacteraceae bacterium]|nr:YqgE/AlgH family protein [Anaeromyxobacteraceae bacterium]
MVDPRFSRTVIYMVQHDANGAMGLIVNRPFKEASIASLLEQLGMEHKGVSGALRMHYGGPVGAGTVFVLHTADYRGARTKVVRDGIALTGSPDVLRAIGSGVGPRRALLLLSYSGWAPGQLEQEIHAGAWVVVPPDLALIFDDDYETKWERALARRDVDL